MRATITMNTQPRPLRWIEGESLINFTNHTFALDSAVVKPQKKSASIIRKLQIRFYLVYS